MKKYIKSIPFFILFLTFSCKAQQYDLDANPYNLPQNAYMKDNNNFLNQYAGTWKASFDNKVYVLTITKFVNKKNDTLDLFQDMLDIKYSVLTADEVLTINTNQNLYFSKTFDNHSIYSFWMQNDGNKVRLTYSGTNCGVGWGLIELTKLTNTTFSWSYSPNSSNINDNDCPSGQDLKIYLPIVKNLIFTKQ